ADASGAALTAPGALVALGAALTAPGALAALGLHVPSVAIFARQVLIGVREIRDQAAFTVVQDLAALAGAQRDQPQQHGFGKLRRVFDRRTGLGFAANGFEPVEFM